MKKVRKSRFRNVVITPAILIAIILALIIYNELKANFIADSYKSNIPSNFSPPDDNEFDDYR